MPLYRIKDFDPNYRDHMEGHDVDVKDLDLYAGGQRVGSVDDVLVDDEGRFRYLIINTGAWIFGKRVLYPIGLAKIDYTNRRVYTDGLTKQQVEALPAFSENMAIDRHHEEQVHQVYRPGMAGNSTINPAAPLGAGVTDVATPMDANASLGASMPLASHPERQEAPQPTNYQTNYAAADAYDYRQAPDMYQLNEQNHQSLRLYEERLIANKRRQKTGEVAVGKRIETESAQVSVPVERERVIIERHPGSGSPVAGTPDLQAGEVARVEVYEEVPEIHKEAFVREEVQVKKVVDRDMVHHEDQIRREELDVNMDGRPIVERGEQIDRR